MTPSRLQARAKNCRRRWLTVMGFGAQALDEGRGAERSFFSTAVSACLRVISRLRLDNAACDTAEHRHILLAKEATTCCWSGWRLSQLDLIRFYGPSYCIK